jgi:hypothetical protein
MPPRCQANVFEAKFAAEIRRLLEENMTRVQLRHGYSINLKVAENNSDRSHLKYCTLHSVFSFAGYFLLCKSAAVSFQ